MKSILKDCLYDQFMIEIDDDIKHSMSFKIYEVNSWESDKTPSDLELYMSGCIKWDGCSHIWFGDKDSEDKHDGYLHLCGKRYWELHCKLMTAIYELAEKTIINFNE